MTERHTHSCPRALVVDDEALIRWSLHAELEEHGFVSREVESLDQARAALSEPLDVAIVDCRLPDGDGLALLDELHAEHPDLPVIVLTGHASVSQAVDAMKRGAFHYLSKPVDPAELVALALEAAEGHPTNGANGANGETDSHHGSNGNGQATVSLPPDGVILDEVERTLLAQALERTAGNRSRAARLLGITRNQIRYRIRKFGLDGSMQAR